MIDITWNKISSDSISISTVCINTGSSITMFVSRRVYSPVLLGFSRPARYRQNGAPKHMVFLDYWLNHIISQSWATGMSYKPFPCICGIQYSTVYDFHYELWTRSDEQKNVRVAWAYWYPTVGGISLAIASASLGTCKSSRRLCSIPDTQGVTPCCSKQGSINALWIDLRGKNGNTSSSDSINSPGNQPPMVPSIALRVFSVLAYRFNWLLSLTICSHTEKGLKKADARIHRKNVASGRN